MNGYSFYSVMMRYAQVKETQETWHIEPWRSCIGRFIEKKHGYMHTNVHYKEREEHNMEASVAIQSLPSVQDDEELCRIVDEVIAYIAGCGYNYYVGPFETTIEGPYDELMDIVKECQHIAIRAGAPSVAAYVKVSYKPEGEVLSIEKKIGKYHA